MGDLLLGKTFTVDPITKQRLDNMGEEEQYYIKDHHESIISKEAYENARKIRERRNRNKKTGRIERYSRQYTFSSKIKCGFCDTTVGRRAWNAGTKNKKVVWYCIKSSKQGKKFCPDSKGMHEDVIEAAFVNGFNEMCANSREIIEEFNSNVEQTLSNSTASKELTAINREFVKVVKNGVMLYLILIEYNSLPVLHL